MIHGSIPSDGVLPLDSLSDLTEERMRVYLAGPLTALSPSQAECCREIRLHAQQILRSRFTVYDPASITPPGTDHSADEVFDADHTRTSTADLVFFHVNAPSLGVGIESQIAAEATVPRLIAHPVGLKVSRMFDGAFNPTVGRIEYLDATDFSRQLQAMLPQVVTAVKNSATKRRPVFATIENAGIGRETFKSRVLLRRSIDELAAATDIRSCMLRRLERDDAVAATFTFVQLLRVAHELSATFSFGKGNVPTLQGPADEAGLPDVATKSLDTLYTWLRSNGDQWVPDEDVFSMWDRAFPLGTATADAARNFDAAVSGEAVSATRWKKIHADVRRDADDKTLFDL